MILPKQTKFDTELNMLLGAGLIREQELPEAGLDDDWNADIKVRFLYEATVEDVGIVKTKNKL